MNRYRKEKRKKKVCPITSGHQVLDKLGFRYPFSYWEGIYILLGFAVGLRILAWLTLELKVRKALEAGA